jgi:hypothetical protein
MTAPFDGDREVRDLKRRVIEEMAATSRALESNVRLNRRILDEVSELERHARAIRQLLAGGDTVNDYGQRG